MDADAIAQADFVVSLANFIITAALGIWGINKIYIESKLASERHKREVDLAKDLELLQRGLRLIDVMYKKSDNYYNMLKTGKAEYVSDPSIYELGAIKEIIGDDELDKAFEFFNVVFDEIENIATSTDTEKIKEHFEQQTFVFTRLYKRIYELIKQKTIEKAK